MKPFNYLFCTERDQHAGYDDGNFAAERAPAVRRLSKTEVEAERLFTSRLTSFWIAR